MGRAGIRCRVSHPHPCPDSQDFYAEHHDSWWPGGAKFEIQRAVTVLFYLESPSDHQADEGAGGGTEFPGLGTNENEPLVVRPPAGDILVWPNFDK